MFTPDLRTMILREMATIRHELALLSDSRESPIGPPDFVRRHTQKLNDRLAQLEQELRHTEDAAAD